MAPEESLTRPRVPEQEDTSSPLFTPAVVANEDNVLTGQLLHPLQHTLQLFTDSLGCTLRRLHGRGRKWIAHKFSQIESSSVGSQEV